MITDVLLRLLYLIGSISTPALRNAFTSACTRLSLTLGTGLCTGLRQLAHSPRPACEFDPPEL
jgi:hypothetical protein